MILFTQDALHFKERGRAPGRGVCCAPVITGLPFVHLPQPSFHEECKFRETLLPNNYNAYESDRYRGTYIALSKYGRVKRGSKVSPIMTVTHFLPRI